MDGKVSAKPCKCVNTKLNWTYLRDCVHQAHDTPRWDTIKLQVRGQIFTGQSGKHGREKQQQKRIEGPIGYA